MWIRITGLKRRLPVVLILSIQIYRYIQYRIVNSFLSNWLYSVFEPELVAHPIHVYYAILHLRTLSGTGTWIPHRITLITCRYRYLVLSLVSLLVGASTCLMPYCPTLLAMYVVSFFLGFGTGALDTGLLLFKYSSIGIPVLKQLCWYRSLCKSKGNVY